MKRPFTYAPDGHRIVWDWQQDTYIDVDLKKYVDTEDVTDSPSNIMKKYGVQLPCNQQPFEPDVPQAHTLYKDSQGTVFSTYNENGEVMHLPYLNDVQWDLDENCNMGIL